ncbi:MAG: LysR family transcriptional regulator [Oceanospirillaceae bacterium]|nr:LysR family transcriptional regulator [Oceanospirillaceae bacterium]
MINNLPLNALQTFAIAAQEGNFTRAADILHITPSAVSHRIKTLEKHLMVVLFTRQAKGVTLTQAGETLLAHINIGMKNIHQGMELCQFSGLRKKLTIAVIPSLGLSWLMMRLNSFNLEHPDIELDLIISDQLVDFSSQSIDAHIHFGNGDYYGLNSRYLSGEIVYPVCHPDLLSGATKPSLTQLLDQHPLLHYKAGIEDAPGGVSWAHWFEHFSLTKPANNRQLWCSHVGMTMSAARYKQGIALGWDKIVAEDIRSGNLVKVGKSALHARFSYYLVTPNRQSPNPQLQAFSAWLFNQFQ